jgi:transcription initiation factor TFIIIB Brf1 subunit/transcription initiation factor TFIIB
MVPKDLETRAYEKFVFPSIGSIDKNCRKLKLKNETIAQAKNLVLEYIEKTYHQPDYTHIKFLLPAFAYIAAIINDDRRTQREIAQAFGTTESSLRKWYTHIVRLMNIKITT